MSGDTNQVLEFELGEETYCVSIDYVTEIVDIGELTEVPNAPRHVEGVMDLRGRTTSIVNPKIVFDIDATRDPERIIVFDPEISREEGAIGWLVDEVDQVSQIEPGNVDQSPGSQQAKSIEGIIKREEGFMIWVNPTAITAS